MGLKTRADAATIGREWLDTRRVFVCIGGVPNTEWAKDTPIVRDRAGYLVTGMDLMEGGKFPKCWTLERPPFYLETSVPGSFAAGDVRRNSIKRVASAVGEGAMAVAFVHRYLGETTQRTLSRMPESEATRREPETRRSSNALPGPPHS